MTIAMIANSHAATVSSPNGPSIRGITRKSTRVAAIATGSRVSAVVTRSTWAKAGSTGSSPSRALSASGAKGSVGDAGVSVMLLP
ncbi:hypothetical protein CVO77_11770 [Sphingopyxis lindanitolerans]|uniref:Uncharacterized protein n=1 Tax=Sphingopyxis lindanitolerans TaxID=2054227 RepID=A0A2S8B9G7_9SPHN|nr:hypothetical protein CVO77_11770 [Sphingopyxis lindanitolerans]